MTIFETQCSSSVEYFVKLIHWSVLYSVPNATSSVNVLCTYDPLLLIFVCTLKDED